MAGNTVGRVQTKYAPGTSERIKTLGDEATEILRKPEGSVTREEVDKFLNHAEQLRKADPPLSNIEALNRLSMSKSVADRAVTDGVMTTSEYMNRRDTISFALAVPSGGGGARIPRNPGTGPMLPRTNSPTVPIQPSRSSSGKDGVVIVKPMRQRGQLDRGKQNSHIPGTNENKVRKADGMTKSKNPTEWADGKQADELTHQAFERGTAVPGKMNPDGSISQLKHDFGFPVGSGGETQVTVHIKQNGLYHGVPSGPKGP